MTRRESIAEYKFADVVVDARDFRVRRADEWRRITPLAFKVLLYLVEHRGRTIEKQEIFESIWRDQFVGDNALTRVVKEIRQVIGDDASAPRFIETVPKRGYRFIAEVEEIEIQETRAVAENEPAEPFSPPHDAPPAVRAKGANYSIVLAALLLVALAAVAGGWWFFEQRGRAAAPVAAWTSQVTSDAGLDAFPAISADGRLVAYSSDRSGSFEIYVKPLASDAREIQITADGNQNFQPAFSPDGTRLAFHSKKRGGIWTVPVSGGAPRQLTAFGTNPAFSPDGRQIAFQSGALTDLGAGARTLPPSVLWLVPTDGGEPRQLTTTGNPAGGHGAPAFSPDGSRLVFNVEDLSSFGFWSIRLADGKLQKISTDGFDPVYAPDGKRIFYASFNGLWQVPVAPDTDAPTGAPTQLADDGPAQIRRLQISADGRKLVYGMLMSRSNLSAITLDARGEAAAPPAPFVQNSAFRNTFPAFSPDGSRVAYVVWQVGSRGSLRLADAADGGGAIELSQAVGVPNWFSDGSRIAFVSIRDGAAKFWSIDVATRRETPLYTFGSDVDFAKIAPNGKEIAFNSKENGTINIWLANLETGSTRQLTFDAEFAGFPVFAPDGKWLAAQIKRGEDTHIVLISAESGESAQLTGEPGQSWVHSISADGERVVFAGQRGDVWNVYTVSRTTREQKKLTDFDRLNAYVRYPAISPAGDKIVFEYAETTGNVWLTELK